MSTREASASPRKDVDPSPSPSSKPSSKPSDERSGRSAKGALTTKARNGNRKRTIVYDDQTGRRQKPVEVRKARRVLRRIDTWSLFRFSALLYACMLVVMMVSVIGLWLVASASGAIPSIENFITQLFALKKFHFKAFQLFAATFALGFLWVCAATLFTVIFGVLYNLITDVVGGIEITVLEEEPLEVVS